MILGSLADMHRSHLLYNIHINKHKSLLRNQFQLLICFTSLDFSTWRCCYFYSPGGTAAVRISHD